MAKDEEDDQHGGGSGQGGNGNVGGDGGNSGPGGHRSVEIEVNGREVKINGSEAKGLKIKQAAIAQGVNIQENFVLQLELPNGSSVIVGDGDDVKLHEHMRFTAIAPDDNS